MTVLNPVLCTDEEKTDWKRIKEMVEKISKNINYQPDMSVIEELQTYIQIIILRRKIDSYRKWR